MPEEVSGRCNNCGQCTAFCPTAAAVQSFSEGHQLEAVCCYEPGRADQYLSFLKSRRSCRSYSAQPLERSVIQTILEAANYAPSGGNNRTLRWIVVEKPETMAQIRALICEWFDTVCRTHPVYGRRYDVDSILARCRAGNDVILRGAPHLAYCAGPETAVWGGVDTGIALTYFNLAAESLGVGCCFAGYATKSAEMPQIRELLGVKEGEKVWCALCFGRKALQPCRVPYRGPVPVTFL
jgi:nitroreductase